MKTITSPRELDAEELFWAAAENDAAELQPKRRE
jgi:hypothetical protein